MDADQKHHDIVLEEAIKQTKLLERLVVLLTELTKNTQPTYGQGPG